MPSKLPFDMKNEGLTWDNLQAARANRYRQRPHLQVHTEEEALGFLNDVGLCTLFSAKGIELPSLWGALCGEDLPLPRHHDSRELGLAWQWKDTLPIAGHVFYGKFLRKRPTFISLDLAPHFYALSPNYGGLDEDYLQDYLDGQLSVESKQVYESLLELGALPTSRLRREAGLSGKANAARFDRALAELQMDFRIVKVAISDANRWGYCYVYDLLPRRFPETVEASRSIKSQLARETILLRYLRTVIAATPHQVSRVLGWTIPDVECLTAQLADGNRLNVSVQIEGLAEEFIVSRV